MAYKKEDEIMRQAYRELLSVFSGSAYDDAKPSLNSAVSLILNYLGEKPVEVPNEITAQEERLAYMLRPSGIMYRRVVLEPGWWKVGTGPFLGFWDNGGIVALLPAPSGGYQYYDPGRKKYCPVDTTTNLSPDAIQFYRVLPQRKIVWKDLFSFLVQAVSLSDILGVFLSSAAILLLGMLLPSANKLLFDIIVPSGDTHSIFPLAVLLGGAMVGNLFFRLFKTLSAARFHNKLDVTTQNAAVARIFSLPSSFFHQYPAGELSARLNSLQTLVQTCADIVLSVGLSFLLSLLFIWQMQIYAPGLVLPGLAANLLLLLLTVLGVFSRRNATEKLARASVNLNSFLYGMFSGIEKIKLAGAEKRVFSQWAGKYARQAKLQYNPSRFSLYSKAFSVSLSFLGLLLVYWAAAEQEVSPSDFIAFSVAYGFVSAAFAALYRAVPQFASVGPLVAMAKPIFDTAPEVEDNKKQVTSLQADIEIANLCFRYTEDTPYIIRHLHLHVAPNEYVAIVGKSGCGKSTLFRLLLGFEKPETGAIYYGGENLDNLNIRSVRRRMGVVLQNDKLFAGTIADNIRITSPTSTMEDLWRAASLAGIAEEIQNMPMGMQTLLSEGASTISGGQKQRLLIARALLPKPDILLFDEATSALDNVTQDFIASRLAELACTRIVIAHRLSTIKKCDRILLLQEGQIQEEGDYTTLMRAKGEFYAFVQRQLGEELQHEHT